VVSKSVFTVNLFGARPMAPFRRASAAAACLSAALLFTTTSEAADAPAKTAPPAKRPNIVFVLMDDAGYSDFGAYGGEIATPNIDQIAKSGVRFTNFHTASTCEASRVMLQSGVDSHLAGAGTLQVVIADNQRGKPGYEGYLNDNAHSLGQLLHDGGYATYYAGKWNLGNGVERSPGARGWDRYIALEQTGADNFEAKVYAPFNMEAVWWEDGKRAQFPADYYSSRHYVDKMIGYIDQGRASGKPFMAMVAFQAVHSPLQAPQPDIEKYMGRYDSGWDKIRAARYQRQVQMGLLPAGLPLPHLPGAAGLPKQVASADWGRMSDSERRTLAKKMAVFAGMLDSADQQVGRLREHLRQTGDLDNTVFIVMSDNGADAFDLSQLSLPFRLWYRANFALGYERLGGPGSYVHYGANWAEVSNTPLALVKGTSGEGGMRVPFIVSYPGRIQGGGIANSFAFATDFLPTVLDIAGIPLPGDEYQGKKLHRPTGTSLLPYLEGKASTVHAPDEAIGYESTGGQAVFKGGYKLMRNGAPLGDNGWHLFKLSDDPTEAHDLSANRPDLVKDLLAEVDSFNTRNGVVLPHAGYDPLRNVLMNNWQVLLRQLGGLLAGVLAAAVGVIAALAYGWRRWRASARSIPSRS
jgi:arylsulfatase A-like enzyme